jgi:hypothetical protein
VVVAERYDRDSRYWVAYPMLHGPVVLIQKDNLIEGDIVTVKITSVANERMVYGQYVPDK